MRIVALPTERAPLQCWSIDLGKPVRQPERANPTVQRACASAASSRPSGWRALPTWGRWPSTRTTATCRTGNPVVDGGYSPSRFEEQLQPKHASFEAPVLLRVLEGRPFEIFAEAPNMQRCFCLRSKGLRLCSTPETFWLDAYKKPIEDLLVLSATGASVPGIRGREKLTIMRLPSKWNRFVVQVLPQRSLV